jgi:hypothetical protein
LLAWRRWDTSSAFRQQSSNLSLEFGDQRIALVDSRIGSPLGDDTARGSSGIIVESRCSMKGGVTRLSGALVVSVLSVQSHGTSALLRHRAERWVVTGRTSLRDLGRSRGYNRSRTLDTA